MISRLIFSIFAPCLGTDLRSIVPQARQAGFDGIQLDAAGQEPKLADLSTTGRKEVRRFLASQNLSLISVRIDPLDNLGIKGDADKALDRIDKYLNVAADLGVPVVSIDLGRLPPAQRVIKPKPKVTPAMAGLLILPESTATEEPESPEIVPTKVDPMLISHWQQVLAHLGEIADRYGTMIALSSTLSSIAALESAMKMVDCPWFGVELDCAALLRDQWTSDEFFDNLGSYVRHIRARDAVVGEDKRSKPTPIGHGDTQWRNLLTHLDEAGYQGAITIDTHELTNPAAAAKNGLTQIKSILQT